MISTVTYNGDGVTRIFPVAFEIKGEEYTVVYVGGVAIADRSLYDIINNSIVFNTAPITGTNNVEIVVASTTTEIADLNAPPSTIQTVLDNIGDINAIVASVIPNLPEILLADDNATIATTKAGEALVSAGEALANKNLAVTSAGNALTSEINADISEANALSYKNSAEASATTATTQAGIATAKAGEASTSATQALGYKDLALGYRNDAEGFATSINPSTLVHNTGNETIAGIKTFSSSPIVPTPTTDMQVATKKYTDDALLGLTFEKIVQGTVVNSTSGTSIDFTGIPSWAKKITVMFNGVSTSGTSAVLIQVGSTTFKTTGYAGQGDTLNNASTSSSIFTSSANSNGFKLEGVTFTSATNFRYGNAILIYMASNIWSINSHLSLSTLGSSCAGTGSVTLSGVLDRVRITTVNGTDTFDAGQINIMYEG